MQKHARTSIAMRKDMVMADTHHIGRQPAQALLHFGLDKREAADLHVADARKKSVKLALVLPVDCQLNGVSLRPQGGCLY
eukprot:365906-Chlamydomonas_euryale.AAC.10